MFPAVFVPLRSALLRRNGRLRAHGHKTNNMSIAKKYRQRGFTLLEAVIVVAIVLVVAAMAAPKIFQFTDNENLRSTAQSYASLMELARMRASDDNHAYEILTGTQNGSPVVYVDLNDNGSVDTGANQEPSVELPKQVAITDTSAPVEGFGDNTNLGIDALELENSPMVTYTNGTARPGLAFNEHGLPCQRIVKLTSCQNSTTVGGNPHMVAWVTYLKYTNNDGTISWAAVSVTPAGRIKTWSHSSGVWK
jgi:prepilin-type N-terminal cleavage/methylation domain-containing protein